MPRLPGVALPFGSTPPGRRTLRPLACRHISASHKLIAAATRGLAGQRAMVMGAGSCQEVPLTVLARHFQQVELLDLDASALRSALRALDPGLRPRVSARRADLSGLTAAFLPQVDTVLARAPDADSAIDDLAALALGGVFQCRPGSPPGAELVVASCVLSQLGIDLQRQIRHRFARRFPDAGAQCLEASRTWAEAQLQLLHSTQRAFLASLHSLTAPGGRAFLSATVQVGQVAIEPDGQWSTPGWYRMTPERHLGPLIGRDWEILLEAQWPWVASPPGPDGREGLVYRVEALVLSPAA